MRNIKSITTCTVLHLWLTLLIDILGPLTEHEHSVSKVISTDNLSKFVDLYPATLTLEVIRTLLSWDEIFLVSRSL